MKAKFKIKSPSNFIHFLKKFVNVGGNENKGLLLELHKDSLKAKSHSEDRSIVKYSKISLGDVLEGSVPEDLIKISLFEINKVAGIFRHFGEADEIFLEVDYENVGGEFISTLLTFKSDSLKIKYETPDVLTFVYITTEMLTRLMDSVKAQKIAEFPFPQNAFDKINSLCSLDDKNSTLTLKAADGVISIHSHSFDYVIGDAPTGVSGEFTFYNKNFSLIEPEISTVIMGREKSLILSQESPTIMVLGKIEG